MSGKSTPSTPLYDAICHVRSRLESIRSALEARPRPTRAMRTALTLVGNAIVESDSASDWLYWVDVHEAKCRARRAAKAKKPSRRKAVSK